MIRKINNTKTFSDVYFEDINYVVSSRDTAYLVQAFYYYYYSTEEAAKQKARSLGISEQIMEQ